MTTTVSSKQLLGESMKLYLLTSIPPRQRVFKIKQKQDQVKSTTYEVHMPYAHSLVILGEYVNAPDQYSIMTENIVPWGTSL